MIINFSKKISLYVHFPFCQRKCAYCDFASEDWQLERIPKYSDALIYEMNLVANSLPEQIVVQTIYFGGGTPNLCGIENFRKVTRAIQEYFNTKNITEFTLEINPGNISDKFLTTLKAEGVNRISLGCQSYNDDELQTLGRIHSSREIEETLAQIEQTGFSNISLDFIYGIPGQTLASWQNTLDKAIQTNATHLSLYCLSYEPGTPLYQAKLRGEVQSADEELEWRMYKTAHTMLAQADFRHYEISNWAKPGYSARHNSNYWEGGEYLGLGASAHSFNGKQRWWNERSVDDYIKSLPENHLPIAGREELNHSDKITEALFLGLRTAEGLDIARFEKLTGFKFLPISQELVDKFGGREALFIMQNKRLALTPGGWFICDSIIENILSIIEELKHDNPQSE